MSEAQGKLLQGEMNMTLNMTIMTSARDAVGKCLATLGGEYDNMLVLTADVDTSSRIQAFKEKYPDRCYNVGIAEQSGAGVAAGLATCGKIPFVVTYAAFGSMRMCEMIRQEICYPHLNVKIACSHGGVTPANDGASHQCIEDMGILSTIPGMTVVMPADYNAARKLTRAAAEFDGPVYLRFTRDAVPEVYGPEQEFVIGKAITLREGTDAAIISIGDTVHIALEAAEELLKQGIKARVLDMHTIKPLDVEAVTKAVNECGKIVTVEDHNIINGLGSAVASIAADMGHGVVKRIGILDQFGQSAPYERLLEMNGITVENIVSIVKGI